MSKVFDVTTYANGRVSEEWTIEASNREHALEKVLAQISALEVKVTPK